MPNTIPDQSSSPQQPRDPGSHGTKAAKSGHLVLKHRKWSPKGHEGFLCHKCKESAPKEPSRHPEPNDVISRCKMFENQLKIPFPIVFSKRRALRDTLEISRFQGGSIHSGTCLSCLCRDPTGVLQLKSGLDSTFRALFVHYFEFERDEIGASFFASCGTL